MNLLQSNKNKDSSNVRFSYTLYVFLMNLLQSSHVLYGDWIILVYTLKTQSSWHTIVM
jgi:hypothetical protein